MAIRAADLEVRVTADASQAQGELQDFNKMFAGTLVGHKIEQWGTGILGFVGDFIDVGATFEQQMTVVDQIIGGSISHIEELKKTALNADIYTMFDAQEVAQGMEMIARAGFSAQQIIGTPGKNDGLIYSMLYFAAATNTDVNEAGQTFSAAARIFEDSGLSMIEIADLLTAAILRSGHSSSEFMTAFQYVGTMSQQWGTAPEDIAASIALLEQLGIRSRSVGTGLRSMYSAFGSKGDEIAALGIDLYDVNSAGEQVLKTLPDIYKQFHDMLAGMESEAARQTLMEDLFGKPASSPLLTLFTTGYENWDRMIADMDSVGSAEDIMEARMDTLRGSLEILSATWLGFKKVLGDSVSEYIKPIIDSLSGFLNKLQSLPKPVLTAIAIFITLTGVLLTLTGAFMIFAALGGMATVGAALGMMAGIALPLAAAFGVLGLAVLALKKNFGGLGDWFDSLSDKWDDFKERLHEGLVYGSAKKKVLTHGKTGVDDVKELVHSGFYQVAINSLAAIRDMGGPNLLGMFKALYPHLLEVSEGFGVVGRSISRLSNVIKKHGIAEGMRQLFMGDIGKDLLKGFGDILSEAPRIFGTFLRNFETGSEDVDRLLKNLGSAFLLFGSVIEDAFDGKFDEVWTDLQAMFRRLGLAAIDVGVLTLRIGGWAFEQAVDIYDSIKNWIMASIVGEKVRTNVAGDGPMGEVRNKTGFSIGTVLLTVAEWAFNGAVSLTLSFQSWLNEKLRETFGDDPTTADLIGHGTGANANTVTIDGIKIHLSPGEITWEETVDWAQLAARLLGDADNKLSAALGADRSEEDLDKSYDAGHTAGENAANSVFHGIRDGINWYADNADFHGSDGGTNAQGGGGGGNSLINAWDFVKKVMLFEPIESDPTFIDEIFQWSSGAGGGIHKAIVDGLNSSIYGSTDHKNELGDGPLGTPPENTQSLGANWWDRFVENIWGKPSDFVVNLAGTIDKYMSSASTFLNTTLPQKFADLFEGIDLSNAFDSVGTGLTGAWNGMIDGLADTLHVPGWAIKLASGDYLGAIRDLFGSGGGGSDVDVPDFTTSPELWSQEKIDEFNRKMKQERLDREMRDSQQQPTPPSGPTPVGTPDYFLPQTRAASGAMASAGSALSSMALEGAKSAGDFSKDVSTALIDITRNFLTFGAGIPLAMTPFETGMKASATTGMNGFTVAIGTGMMIAAAAAALGAQMVAISAQIPSLYNNGFSAGQSLGLGMSAGMMSTLGAIAAARAAMQNTANGTNVRNTGFGPTTGNGVPVKAPTVVNQTNHVNIDPKNVNEFFSTANFVSNLDRDRQIVLGRA